MAAVNSFQTFTGKYNKTLNTGTGAVKLSDTAIGFTAAEVAAASRAVIATETQACRVTLSGTTPTSSVGLKYAADSKILVSGGSDLANLQIIALVDGLILQIELQR